MYLTVRCLKYFMITAAGIVHNVNSTLVTSHEQKPLCIATTCLLLEDITSSLLCNNWQWSLSKRALSHINWSQLAKTFAWSWNHPLNKSVERKRARTWKLTFDTATIFWTNESAWVMKVLLSGFVSSIIHRTPVFVCFFILNKSVSEGFGFNSDCSERWQNDAHSRAKLSLTFCSILIAVCLCGSDFIFCYSFLPSVRDGLPCGLPGFFLAWIIQTDVVFPQCPSSVLRPLSHQLISTMALIAESTICSAPALFEMGRPPHLDPCLPLLLFLLFILSVYCLYLWHRVQQGFSSPSCFIVLIYQCRNQGCSEG